MSITCVFEIQCNKCNKRAVVEGYQLKNGSYLPLLDEYDEQWEIFLDNQQAYCKQCWNQILR